MLKSGQFLTLTDNKRYVVVLVTNYKEEQYGFLIDEKDCTNIMICRYDDNNLYEIKDNKLIEKLLLLFHKNNISK